jgi:ankyrin repeat protein
MEKKTQELKKHLFYEYNWWANMQEIKRLLKTYQDELAQFKHNKTPQGDTLINLTARYGEAESMQLLLSTIGDKNLIDDANYNGTTPLMNAIIEKKPEMIHLLLDYEADTNKLDNYGASALTRAAAHGTPDLIKLMVVKYKAQINLEQKMTPLSMAILFINLDNVRALLTLGANPNNQAYGKSPLFLILDQYSKKQTQEKKDLARAIARILLENGANSDELKKEFMAKNIT